jgi:flagellar hook-associated protein FlgK
MSASNPFSSAFELQRTMIDQSRRAAETGIDVQRTAVESWFGTFESAKSVQKSGVTLSKTTIDAYLDGLKSVFPEESVAELEAAVDEQFDAVDEIHEDAWQSFLEGLDEAEATYDEMTEMQLELLAESFDALEELQSDAEETAEEAVASAEELAESA